MNKDLTVGLYKSIKDKHKPREIKHWHASSIAKCPRALYLERLKVPAISEPTAGKILRWSAGHLIEEVIREHLTTIYPKLITNVRFTNEELDLTGEFDAYDPDSKTLISVKSVHDRAMMEIDGVIGLKEDSGKTKISPRSGKPIIVWRLKQEPYTHHQWQEMAYVILMHDPNSKIYDRMGELEAGFKVHAGPIENITYLYISLSGLMCAYTTPVRQDILKRVEDKLKYLRTSYAASTLPVCLCQEGQEMFKVTDQYCDYKSDSGCCSPDLTKEVENAV